VAASHTFTVPSWLTEARRVPSGLKATPWTPPSCPVRVRACWPVAASHIFTVRSQLAEASRLPSGLKATLWTPPSCPWRVRAC
jgi:hypothetical protein